MTENIWEKTAIIMESVRKKAPLIHCITNPISIHDCANVILAAGARPIMAEHPEEVREITAGAAALGLNLGNITDARKASILISAEEASRREIPTVLDLVGIGCSGFRRNITSQFLEMRDRVRKQNRTVAPLVLKGNLSEILVLSKMEDGEILRTSGVDARAEDVVNECTRDEIVREIRKLARRHQAVVLATGETDILSDRDRTFLVENGSARMASITGTGCMVTALCAACISQGDLLAGSLLAAVMLGICGERASRDWKGTGTYQVRLMDELSECTVDRIMEERKVQEV